MASDITYDWTIYCINEGVYKDVTQKARPTVCPTDPTHTLNSSLSTYSVSLNPSNLLNISQNPGYFCSSGISFSCAASTTTTFDQIYPYDVTIIVGKMLVEDANQGDVLNIILTPNLTIGTLTQNASIGDTVIYVDDTAINNYAKGVYFTINSGPSTYYIKSLNLMDSTITLTTALAEAYVSGNTIQRNIPIVQNFTLPSKGIVLLGELNHISTYIPAGATFRFLYTNNTSSVKTFNFLLSFF